MREAQTRNLDQVTSGFRVRSLRDRPGMTLSPSYWGDSNNVSFHRTRHLSCHRALFLHVHSGGEGARGEALRCLLYLFERDEALPLIGAG